MAWNDRAGDRSSCREACIVCRVSSCCAAALKRETRDAADTTDSLSLSGNTTRIQRLSKTSHMTRTEKRRDISRGVGCSPVHTRTSRKAREACHRARRRHRRSRRSDGRRGCGGDFVQV